MKKLKLRGLLLLHIMLAVFVTGCKDGQGENADAVRPEVSEEVQAEDRGTESAESSKEAAAAEEAVSWLESHGLVITPQGDFTYQTMGVDADDNDTELFEVPSQVKITESTEGVEDGYKQVTAVFTEDMINNIDGGYWNYISAFDRYTGISFEFDTETTYTDFGETAQKDGFVTIGSGKDTYSVAVSQNTVNDYPFIEESVTVTCPESYDGTVFQIGRCDAAQIEKFMEMDMTARLYTIDELPFYGEGYYYFAYGDK